MAHPNAHILLKAHGSFGGNYASNQEKWTAGLRLGVIGADVMYDAAALQTFANAARAAFSTFHNSTDAYAGTQTYFHECTAARIGPNGRYLPLQQETIHTGGTPIAGLGSPTQPWNTACVISLRTSNFRGYASNGRFYYPMIVGGIDPSSGRILSAVSDNRIAAAKTLFDAINTAGQAYAENMRIIVSSATGSTAAKVTAIRSDERLDSIERRENAGATVWHNATLAP